MHTLTQYVSFCTHWNCIAKSGKVWIAFWFAYCIREDKLGQFDIKYGLNQIYTPFLPGSKPRWMGPRGGLQCQSIDLKVSPFETGGTYLWRSRRRHSAACELRWLAQLSLSVVVPLSVKCLLFLAFPAVHTWAGSLTSCQFLSCCLFVIIISHRSA